MNRSAPAHRTAKLAALAIAALIIAVGVTWYLASPAWTLHQMKAAADANDPDALNAYIDYPALRENLKAEAIRQLTAEAQKDKSGFGSLGLAIGSALIGPAIGALVTPAGMRAALFAKRDQPRSHGTPKAASSVRVPDEPVIRRRSISEFLVSSKQQPNGGLVFTRHGLSWKLSGVKLASKP